MNVQYYGLRVADPDLFGGSGKFSPDPDPTLANSSTGQLLL